MDANVFVYSGGIDAAGYGALVQALQPSDDQPLKPNSVLILTTTGGLPNSAYQIARLLQNISPGEVALCIPSFCKSAGTLIALGANKIIMNSISELGPLDVQLRQRHHG